MHTVVSVGVEPPSDFMVPANVTVVENDNEEQGFQHRVTEMSSQVNLLEQKVQAIEQYYSCSAKKQKQHMNSKTLRDKDKGRTVSTIKIQPDRITPSVTMQELMCQFGLIMDQVIQTKGARSSVDAIDADDLGLHNCPEIDGKPRDFSMIKKRMERKDVNGYHNVREIYTDVRWVLKNAMKYNDERSDAYVTAKVLLAKFEEKWLLLLPKLMQEEEEKKEDEAFQQAYHAKMAKETSSELYEVELRLNELKELVLQRCRKMSTLEKRELGRALAQLSADDLQQALEIVAQSNPAFQATAEEVDLDIDEQSESTLRRLKYFILEVMHAQGNAKSTGVDNNDTNTEKLHNSISKRKRETPDTIFSGAIARKKTKKQ